MARDLLDRAALPVVSRVHALLTLGHIGAARGATKRARRLLAQAYAAARYSERFYDPKYPTADRSFVSTLARGVDRGDVGLIAVG